MDSETMSPGFESRVSDDFFFDFFYFFIYLFLLMIFFVIIITVQICKSALLSLLSFSSFITPYDAQASSAFSALIS